MTNKQLIKYLQEAADDSEVMFITEDGIYEVLTVAFIEGYCETSTEFHCWLEKVDEITPIGEDNTYE